MTDFARASQSMWAERGAERSYFLQSESVFLKIMIRSLNTLSAARSAHNAPSVINQFRICGIDEAIVCLS